MDAKTKGAWLIHHTLKLQQINGVQQFDKIFAAGKAGILLSALSASDQTSLGKNRVELLAKAANINTVFELPKLLELLEAQSLIEVSNGGVDVLGVTTSLVVQHAAAVYEGLEPSPTESAALEFSEITSQEPLRQKESKEYLGDKCKLTSSQTNGLLEQAEDVDGLLKQNGCVTLTEVTKALGLDLFKKLNSIAMYDISVVNNDKENVAFVTRPAAFSKFGNPLVEDALDLAKAFVSSLTYGMTRSYHARGRIRMIEKLMTKLINGGSVGPVDAIGKDYRALEMKGVVQVKPNPQGGYFMTLLKRDIGVVALEVIKAGDATEALLNLPGATVTGYVGPEANREKTRKKQTLANKSAAKDIVMALRTGSKLK